MIVTITSQERPTFDVVVNPPPIVGVVVVGLPGPPGPAGTTIHVGPTPPANPALDELWVDTT